MELPGERLVLRLWETIAEKGVGSLLKPWQMRREGRAQLDLRREELMVLAQAERDAEDILAGRARLDDRNRLLELPAPAAPVPIPLRPAPTEPRALQSSTRVASDNLVADALRKEVNVAKAVLAAESELGADAQEPAPRQVEDDWLFRWRDCASTVSGEELQNLWGRVLAGEIKSPGTFSLRTLDFLKNLSQQEAIKIAQLCRFAIKDVIYRGDKELLEAEGITFGFLLEMQQLGVIAGVEAMGLTLTLKSVTPDAFVTALVSNDRVLIVTADDPGKQFTLDVCQLTAIGRQILRLGNFQPHEDYLKKVGEVIRAQGFKVQLARWQQLTEAEGRYFDTEDLEEPGGAAKG